MFPQSRQTRVTLGGRALLSIVTAGLLLAALTWASTHEGPAAAPGSLTPAEDRDVGEVAPLIRSWERAIPAQTVPDGLETLRASECEVCHEAIVAEWRLSAHAHALSDPQFQEEWAKDDQIWLCLNCHTPLENQMSEIVVGTLAGDFRRPVTEANPDFDAELRDEAITCATCHVRDGAIIGSSGGTEAPHTTRLAEPGFFSDLCITCHNVQDRLTPTLVCSFATGDEWMASPASAEGGNCYLCHMPEVERPLVVGDAPSLGHRHSWVGAGIAKSPSDEASMRALYRPGYDVELHAELRPTDSQTPALEIGVAIINVRAGHYLPTGDPERFITLDLTVTSETGTTLWTHTERIGEVWEWYPEANQVSDNSLAPGERRQYVFEVPAPSAATIPLSVSLVVRNHRMTEENARAHDLLGRYPLAIEAVRRTVTVDGTAAPSSSTESSP